MIHKRIVVKVGTSTLTHENGELNLERLERLVRALSELMNRGHEVILVTSGAIAVGVSALGRDRSGFGVPEKQAAAAVGQSRLMHIYDKLFAEYGHSLAQILLSRYNLSAQEQRVPLLNTIETLLEWRVLPIINANDAVHPEEILSGQGIFGDNDTLSAAVAALAGAGLLILLTDIDGLYTGDPRKDPGASLIGHVSKITGALREGSGGAGSSRGRGGMLSKLDAAETALREGFDMVVALGKNPEVLYDIIEGKPVGTLFRKEII